MDDMTPRNEPTTKTHLFNKFIC